RGCGASPRARTHRPGSTATCPRRHLPALFPAFLFRACFAPPWWSVARREPAAETRSFHLSGRQLAWRRRHARGGIPELGDLELFKPLQAAAAAEHAEHDQADEAEPIARLVMRMRRRSVTAVRGRERDAAGRAPRASRSPRRTASPRGPGPRPRGGPASWRR